jgi:hypothetical protein
MCAFIHAMLVEKEMLNGYCFPYFGICVFRIVFLVCVFGVYYMYICTCGDPYNET